MAEVLWLREQAARALRLARDSTDPMLIKQLQASAADYTSQANAIENGEPENGPHPHEQ